MVTRLPDEGEALRPPALPQPVVPLEYAPPQARSSRRDFWLGLVIAIVFAGGVGSLTFGLLMSSGWRDDYAIPVAFGLGLMMLALQLAGLLWWLRRSSSR
jgi:hypothetical protein